MKTTISYFFCTVLFSFFMFTAQAQVAYKASKEYGSTSGKNFVLPYGKVKSQLSNINKIRTIAIHFDHGVGGRGIKQICVGWIKKDGGKISQKAIQKKGSVKYIYLDNDEYITKITGQDHPVLTKITFYTNKGKRYGPFGKKLARNQSPFQIRVPLGFEVIGFSGKADQTSIKSLALVYRIDELKVRTAKIAKRNAAKEKLNAHKSRTRSSNNTRVDIRRTTDHKSSSSSRAQKPRTTDHRSSTKKGSSWPPRPKNVRKRKPGQNKRSNVVDHRKKEKEKHQKWLDDNYIDMDRAGG